MSFTFWPGAFKWGGKHTQADIEVTKGIIRDGVLKDMTSTEISKAIKARGVGYRNTNMLHDISLAQATGWSRTLDKYERSFDWFKTIEKIRFTMKFKNRGLAIKWWKQWVQRSHTSLKSAEMHRELMKEEWTAKGGTP